MKVILCSHGSLASGALDSISILAGDTPNIKAYDFFKDNLSLDDKIEEIFRDIQADEKVIFLTDLFGGSVNQALIRKKAQYPNIDIIAGFNLALLLELSICNDETDEKYLDYLVERSKSEMILFKASKEVFKDDFDF